MSRKCPNCAADVLENAKFCIKCGTKMPPNVTLGSTPTPFANRVPPPVSTTSNSSGAEAVFTTPPPVPSAEPKKEEVGIAQVESVKASIVNNETKNESSKSSGSKAIIFGGAGVLIAAIGGFLLTSGKDEPTKAISSPVVTSPAIQSAPPVPAPPPAAVIPPKPSAPTAPVPTVTPAPIAQKPASPPPVAVPAPAPPPSVPDVNKLMRDAANK